MAVVKSYEIGQRVWFISYDEDDVFFGIGTILGGSKKTFTFLLVGKIKQWTWKVLGFTKKLLFRTF